MVHSIFYWTELDRNNGGKMVLTVEALRLMSHKLHMSAAHAHFPKCYKQETTTTKVLRASPGDMLKYRWSFNGYI